MKLGGLGKTWKGPDLTNTINEESDSKLSDGKFSLSFRMRNVFGGGLSLGGLSSRDLIDQKAQSLKDQ